MKTLEKKELKNVKGGFSIKCQDNQDGTTYCRTMYNNGTYCATISTYNGDLTRKCCETIQQYLQPNHISCIQQVYS